MSSITVSEASGFSNPDVSQRYHFDDRPVDQFFEVLPMEPIEGHQKRVNTVQAGDLYTHASLVTGNGGAVAATLPATLTREGNLSHFAARLEVDSLVADEYSSHRDVVHSLLQVKVAALLARFQYQLVRGDQAQAGEFQGLIKLGGSTSFGADGGNADGGVVAKGEIEKIIGALGAGGIAGVFGFSTFGVDGTAGGGPSFVPQAASRRAKQQTSVAERTMNYLRRVKMIHAPGGP